jgi:MOSC domain-containing protein YiiM
MSLAASSSASYAPLFISVFLFQLCRLKSMLTAAGRSTMWCFTQSPAKAHRMTGQLVAIAIAPQAKAAMESVPSAEVVAGLGIVGDRYGAGRGAAQFQGRRAPEKEITLIAREAIGAANDEFYYTIEHLDTRRNLLTEGVPLNDLVGKTFRVGPVLIKGLELCEPCGYLEKRTFNGIKAALKHRGGLRCCVIEGGTIRVGDAVAVALAHR